MARIFHFPAPDFVALELRTTLPDGSTIVLRTPREEDVPTIFAGAESSRAELAPWMPWCHENFCIEDAEKWVNESTANEAERAFSIWDETQQLFLGNCGLHEIHPKLRSAKAGYWVRTSHTGRGIATAAARAVADYAFGELKLVRLELEIGIGNCLSQRVAEKLGATREGVRRNGFIHGERVVDIQLYSLIPADFGLE